MLNGEITSTFLHKGWISISYKSTYCTVFTHLQHPSTSPPSTGPQLQWTSPSRLLSVGVGGAAAAAVAYTEVKRQHLNTAAECASSGIHFLPLVVETTGAWAPEAQKALNQIARSVALRRGEEASFYPGPVFPRSLCAGTHIPGPCCSSSAGCLGNWFLGTLVTVGFLTLPSKVAPSISGGEWPGLHAQRSLDRSPSFAQGCARWCQRPGSPLSEPFPFFGRWPFCNLLSSLPPVFVFRPLVVCLVGFLSALAAAFFMYGILQDDMCSTQVQ